MEYSIHSFSQIEVKESRNAFSLLPIKLGLSDLGLFAIISGHVCTDVTLACRDGLREDGSDVQLSGKGWYCISSVGIPPA